MSAWQHAPGTQHWGGTDPWESLGSHSRQSVSPRCNERPVWKNKTDKTGVEAYACQHYSEANASALMFSCGYISCWHQGRLSGGPKGPLGSFLWLYNYPKIKSLKIPKHRPCPELIKWERPGQNSRLHLLTAPILLDNSKVWPWETDLIGTVPSVQSPPIKLIFVGRNVISVIDQNIVGSLIFMAICREVSGERLYKHQTTCWCLSNLILILWAISRLYFHGQQLALKVSPWLFAVAEKLCIKAPVLMQSKHTYDWLWECTPLIPTPRRQRHVDLLKFEAKMVCINSISFREI